MTGPPQEDWFDKQGRIDPEIVEAMYSAATWSEGCVAAARAAGVPKDEVLEVYGPMSGWNDKMLFHFLTVHMAGSSWGLYVRDLGGTAFLLSNVDEPYEEYVWAAWSPPGDRAALERAVMETWLAHWEDIPLPPAIGRDGVLWEGPKEEYELAYRCLDELLVSSDAAWAVFKEEFDVIVERLAALQSEGVDFEGISGSAPRSMHDVDWLNHTVVSGDLDACREDRAARGSLVSYFLM